MDSLDVGAVQGPVPKGPPEAPQELARLQADALMLMRGRRLDEADKKLGDAESLGRHWYTAFLLGRVRQERGEHSEAVTLFRLAEERYWEGLVATAGGKSREEIFHDMSAEIARARADPDVVMAMADPQLSLILGNLGAALTNAGQHSEARDVFRRAIQIHTRDSLALSNLGHLEYVAQNWSASERHLREALSHDPQNPCVRVNLGATLQASGRRAEARDFFTGVLRADPKHANAWIGLGELALEEGAAQDAVNAFGAALSLGAEKSKVYFHRSIALLAVGRPSEAVKDARRAVDLDPRCSEAWAQLGKALLEAAGSSPERLAEAESALNQALSLDPTSPDARLGLANVAKARANRAENR